MWTVYDIFYVFKCWESLISCYNCDNSEDIIDLCGELIQFE